MKKIKNTNYLKIFILFLIVYVIPINCYATPSETLGELEGYAGTQIVSTKFLTKANVIIGVIQTVGSIVSVICLIVLGVKYMMGSVEEKAEYKKTLMPYMLGALMVFGISNILGIVYTIGISLH